MTETKRSIFITLLTSLSLTLFATASFAKATLIHNVQGYTLTGKPGNDAKLLTFQAMVFDNGKVLYVGDKATASERFPDATAIDGKGKTLLPGLTDAHGHILGLGQGLSTVDLRGAESEQEAA